jgi:hypothetical protein
VGIGPIDNHALDILQRAALSAPCDKVPHELGQPKVRSVTDHKIDTDLSFPRNNPQL